MFNGMGIQWASTLLGCVAAIAVPMPIFFYIYGKRIRGRSKFAPAPDIEQDKRRDEESVGATNETDSEEKGSGVGETSGDGNGEAMTNRAGKRAKKEE
jgi:DHA1 family multidrug resistance protein-like MFS transporter